MTCTEVVTEVIHTIALQRKLFKCQRVGETNKNCGVVKQWMGFPGGSDGKESACSAGDPGSGPGSGRSPGGGHGTPLRCSCLENPMDRGAWRAAVLGVTKDTTEWLTYTNNGTPMIHQWYTTDLPMIHQWSTNDTPMIYQWSTNDAPMIYQWYTNDTSEQTITCHADESTMYESLYKV